MGISRSKSGSSSGTLAVPDELIFTGANLIAAREARTQYFLNNPLKLTNKLFTLLTPANAEMVLETYTNEVWSDATIIIEGPKGLKGDQGIPGPVEVNLIHNQIVVSDLWIINHGLNRFPSVTIVTSAGDEVEGDLFYNSPNSLQISFSAPFAGKAYLN